MAHFANNIFIVAGADKGKKRVHGNNKSFGGYHGKEVKARIDLVANLWALSVDIYRIETITSLGRKE